MPLKWRLGLVGMALFAIASYLTAPPPSTGAPILSGARVPLPVLGRLDSACRDCHSDATRYPWYSYLAPASVLIRRDVENGRQRLNLSQWQELPSVRRQRWLSEIANQVQDGGMPLSIYTWLHRDARLTEADKILIFEWTQAERARLITEAPAK